MVNELSDWIARGIDMENILLLPLNLLRDELDTLLSTAILLHTGGATVYFCPLTLYWKKAGEDTKTCPGFSKSLFQKNSRTIMTLKTRDLQNTTQFLRTVYFVPFRKWVWSTLFMSIWSGTPPSWSCACNIPMMPGTSFIRALSSHAQRQRSRSNIPTVTQIRMPFENSGLRSRPLLYPPVDGKFRAMGAADISIKAYRANLKEEITSTEAPYPKMTSVLAWRERLWKSLLT